MGFRLCLAICGEGKFLKDQTNRDLGFKNHLLITLNER